MGWTVTTAAFLVYVASRQFTPKIPPQCLPINAALGESVNRAITIILSIVLLACAAVHWYLGGLLVQAENRVIYSNELLSSGGDSSFAVLLGLSAFVVSLLGGLLGKKLFLSSILALVFFDFMLFLANLDVSLTESVLLGDHTLLVAFIFAYLLAVFHLTSQLTTRLRRRTQQSCAGY
ncbi:MAG: hypothetical protein CMI08_10090 [Oceanospirillaceae bacterium]|uniref:hypothetical protein n=1 Tax=unclassified Thalassolituus TaxID=2624967 RepID=UPI000C5E53D3|nr:MULTISPECIES: hypothetical protein [unclassified Thalassolituus]MAS23945.1 hypothetical protein [Oceanospirillaceae bacterium]MAX99535.1 hypothetical protein [Oceanospirillaceae bacterium]MBL35093.1 hypothetical protein [Oceanospirillaceae bacterium]MBS54903.1 hypothetical protein [Oceanospirillaceae bacterium]